jgi:hypothetical protein
MSEHLDPRIAAAAAEAKALAETLLAEGWEGQDGLTYFVISVISEPRMRSDYLLLLSEALVDFADVVEGYKLVKLPAHYRRLAAHVADLAPGRAD